MSNGQEFDRALKALMTTLQTYLPAPPTPPPPVPAGSIGVSSVTERALSVGNLRGDETRSGIGTVGLKGGRIEARVRFQLWAEQPGDAEQAIQTLTQNVLDDRDKLRAQGFLKLALANTLVPENIGANLWRDTAEFNILYEYHFQESDGQGLIARIPVRVNSVYNESTLVSDEMARWDDVAAPALVVRGRTEVGRISVLDFAPGAKPAGAVTLLRTREDASGAPTTHASLVAFLAAVAGDTPAQAHAQFVFASWTAFLAALTPNPDQITLGADPYTPREIVFDPAIQLPGAADRFEIRYQNPAFEQVAVAYLRTQRG